MVAIDWERMREEEEKRKRECTKKAVFMWIPKDMFEIKRVEPVWGGCLIDVVRKDYEPDIDCEEYCDAYYWEEGEEEEYERCKETCEENLKIYLTGSIRVDMNGTIKEMTIPGSCEYVWMSELEDPEEWERRREEFLNKLEKIGCQVDEGWIHPHEVAELGMELEEYPAICYYHVKNCNIVDLMRIIRGNI